MQSVYVFGAGRVGRWADRSERVRYLRKCAREAIAFLTGLIKLTANLVGAG
ncbi:hypothetical protein [Tumidithrix elongata]|uniref:hypothetical protein n=1 Tax=Tumidithrix elongata TaxID=3088357 RepID=UPI002ED28632